MDTILNPLSETTLDYWLQLVDDWILVLAALLLVVELVRYGITKKLNWTLGGDVVTNFITQGMFLVITYVLLAGLYLGSYFYAYQFALFDININFATVAICVVLVDLVYYWEHRFSHRVNMAWATHTVHHSSPYFNISVAYRFGPMDGVWSIAFYLPLVLLGFNPIVVLVAEAFVLAYQTLLHTEVIGKLPKPIEAVMNTPSHHRVHHGSNAEYLDKNYAGVFIIWDRLFGTFAEEKEKVVYGLVEPINSVNPFVVFLHGFQRLGKRILSARGIGNKIAYLFRPPDWTEKNAKARLTRAPAE